LLEDEFSAPGEGPGQGTGNGSHSSIADRERDKGLGRAAQVEDHAEMQIYF